MGGFRTRRHLVRSYSKMTLHPEVLPPVQLAAPEMRAPVSWEWVKLELRNSVRSVGQ